MQSNRVEYLAACCEVSRLSEEARRTKWEEFLADLEGNLDPARAWNLIKSLSGFPPLHCLQRTPKSQRPHVSNEHRKSQRLHSAIRSCEPTLIRQNRAFSSSSPEVGNTATDCSQILLLTFHHPRARYSHVRHAKQWRSGPGRLPFYLSQGTRPNGQG